MSCHSEHFWIVFLLDFLRSFVPTRCTYIVSFVQVTCMYLVWESCYFMRHWTVFAAASNSWMVWPWLDEADWILLETRTQGTYYSYLLLFRCVNVIQLVAGHIKKKKLIIFRCSFLLYRNTLVVIILTIVKINYQCLLLQDRPSFDDILHSLKEIGITKFCFETTIFQPLFAGLRCFEKSDGDPQRVVKVYSSLL